MTFSEQIKEELIHIKDDSLPQKLATLAAIVKINGKLHIRNGSLEISIKSENQNIAEFVMVMFEKVFNVKANFSYFRNVKLKKNNYFIITTNQEPLRILKELEIVDKKGNINAYPSAKFVSNNDILSCYIRGAFLASGSVNHPSSTGGYHLEISCSDEQYACYLTQLINRFPLNAKISKRRNQYIAYLKRGESIADFLKLINATQALLDFEYFRIDRDFENNSNRTNNCYFANEIRRQEVAKKQLELIELIEKNNLLQTLDERTQILIKYRKDNPEWSLNDIADTFIQDTGIKLSKSTVRLIFMKLEEMVANL